MPRLNVIEPDTATGKQKELLDAAQAKFGAVPNMFKGMVNSPAVLDAYFAFSGEVANAKLDAATRELIGLAVGQASRCDYCVAAHTAIGKGAGLNDDAMLAARRGEGTDARSTAAVRFDRKFVENRGWVSDDEVQALRDAGFDDAELAEVVAVVALSLFTNYFNHLNETEVDFPVPAAID